MTNSAMFVNYTNEEFTGYWDGKARKFKAGSKTVLPVYLAEHFAKHLTNKVLTSKDRNGNEIHPNGEKMTSPKFPEQVPMFMDLFNKACIPMDNQVDEGTVDEQIEVLSRQAEEVEEEIEEVIEEKPKNKGGRPKKVVVEEEEEDEDNFEGKIAE